MRKTIYYVSNALAVLLIVLSLVSCASTEKAGYSAVQTEVPSLEANTFTTKYGNLYTSTKAADLMAEGNIDWGDIVSVSFLDNTIELPVVPNYSYVDTGVAALVLAKEPDGSCSGYVQFAINMGNFTENYGIATKTTNADKTWFWTANDGVELPLVITVSVAEKGGYLSEYLIRDLVRTNERADYAKLSDAEFANFRKVSTTGMSNLYRTSNPANAELGRNTYADKELKKAGVTVVVNLSDDKATAESRPEFKGSYYSTCNVKYLNLGVDFSSAEFKNGLAEGLRFIAANKGTYAVHCTEGKDRAGFVSALLECLMGASAEEVANDYMVTYYNYYGVEKGTEKYNAILSSNIVKTLQSAFDVKDFYSANLQKCAENYIRNIGLTDAEIQALKANL